jgi:hypothetical protein
MEALLPPPDIRNIIEPLHAFCGQSLQIACPGIGF